MTAKSFASYALRTFFDKVGLPELIISDNANEQRSQEWMKLMRDFGVKERKIEAYRSWQNYAENGVKMIKFRAARIMEQAGVPGPLWSHVVEYTAALSNRLVHKTPRLEGRTPWEYVFGETPDLSAFIDFSFYDYVW